MLIARSTQASTHEAIGETLRSAVHRTRYSAVATNPGQEAEEDKRAERECRHVCLPFRKTFVKEVAYAIVPNEKGKEANC